MHIVTIQIKGICNTGGVIQKADWQAGKIFSGNASLLSCIAIADIAKQYAFFPAYPMVGAGYMRQVRIVFGKNAENLSAKVNRER